jgi:hypothetical protein
MVVLRAFLDRSDLRSYSSGCQDLYIRKVKIKIALEEAMKAQSGSTSIALLFL